MGKAMYTLRVSPEITDAELEKTLRAILPDILKQKFGVNEVIAKDVAPGLARAIVQNLRQCAEKSVANHFLNDISQNKIQLGPQPSKETCEQFQKDLAEIVNVRFGGKAYQGMSKVEKIAGIIWAHVIDAVGPSEEEKEKREAPYRSSAVAGVRG